MLTAMKDDTPLTLLPPEMISIGGERAPLRMAVEYPNDGYTPLPSKNSCSAMIGYALEPAIYRVRMLQDEPLGAPPNRDDPA